MSHKGFYIVGGALVTVGAILYFSKKKSTSKGESATIPPLEATNVTTPPIIEDVWLTIKGLITKKQ